MILIVICIMAGIIIGAVVDGDFSVLLGAWIGTIVGFLAVIIIIANSFFLHDVPEKYELKAIRADEEDIWYLQDSINGYTYVLQTEKGEHEEYVSHEDCYMNYENEAYVIIHRLEYNNVMSILMLGTKWINEDKTLSYEFHVPKDSILK